ncbi:MAG: sulfotransferase [Verrucomicrobiota bacterium]
MRKIIQIGFNKCGTRSLYHFFMRNGIPSVHFMNGIDGKQIERGTVARSMMENLTTAKAPFHGHEEYAFYSDLTTPAFMGLFEGHFFFREIYESYPESFFILNTRNVEDWIQSRLNHGGNQIKRFREHYGLIDDQDVVKLWRNQWESHHDRVTGFFSDKTGKLIVFDIDRHGGEYLAKALEPTYSLDPKLWGHYGKTEKRYRREE